MNTREKGKSGRQNREYLGMRRVEGGVGGVGVAKAKDEMGKHFPNMCNGK